MLGKLTQDQIEQVLHAEVIGRIGCHSEGLTYVVPVTFAYDGQRIIVHSAEGMKVQMMRSNPSVCFQVDQIQDIANWRSVILWGEFRELEDIEAALGMGLLIERMRVPNSDETSYYQTKGPMKATVYEIRIGQKTGRYEKSQ